jgi:hypothetical protein
MSKRAGRALQRCNPPGDAPGSLDIGIECYSMAIWRATLSSLIRINALVVCGDYDLSNLV